MMTSAVCGGGPLAKYKHWHNGKLQVSSNGRYIEHANGKPFLWFGDTLWVGMMRFDTVAERRQYLADRAAKGFNVIQACCTGLPNPNKSQNICGDFGDGMTIAGDFNRFQPDEAPFPTSNPASPNTTFFSGTVDSFIDLAKEYNLYVSLGLTWGTYVAPFSSQQSDIFTNSNATSYGTFIANRYSNRLNVMFVTGQDRRADALDFNSVNHIQEWINMGTALHNVLGSTHLVSHHTASDAGSWEALHDETWLDYNTLESGHGLDGLVAMVADGYAQSPAKPVVNYEPLYEGETDNALGTVSQRIRRSQVYWTFLAGGCGYAYGHCALWSILHGETGNSGGNTNNATYPELNGTHWTAYLSQPSVLDHANWYKLWLNLPWWQLIPDQTIITANAGTGTSQAVAARGSGGDIVVVYYATNASRTIDKSKITSSANASVKWVRPTDLLEDTSIGTVSTTGTQAWTPPGGWEDAVLIMTAV